MGAASCRTLHSRWAGKRSSFGQTGGHHQIPVIIPDQALHSAHGAQSASRPHVIFSPLPDGLVHSGVAVWKMCAPRPAGVNALANRHLRRKDRASDSASGETRLSLLLPTFRCSTTLMHTRLPHSRPRCTRIPPPCHTTIHVALCCQRAPLQPCAGFRQSSGRRSDRKLQQELSPSVRASSRAWSLRGPHGGRRRVLGITAPVQLHLSALSVPVYGREAVDRPRPYRFVVAPQCISI